MCAMQIQKTADNLKRVTAKLEQKNKTLTGDIETQRKELNQQLFTAQQEADKVHHSQPLASVLCTGAPELSKRLEGVHLLHEKQGGGWGGEWGRGGADAADKLLMVSDVKCTLSPGCK